MSLGTSRRWPAIVLLSLLACTFVLNSRGAAAQEEVRRIKTRVQPTYPELARTMHITGTVRVIVLVAPGGTVQSVRALGGHPLLVGAATDAVKRWKFEPASKETTTVMEFKFSGGM